MAPFQGKAPARLSALLLEILDRLQHTHGAGGMQQWASAVAELSRLFTKGRHALGRDYFSDPALAAAYLCYFFPVNLAKIQALLDELPGDWPGSSESRGLHVLDVGTGPGTGAIAVVDWLSRRRPDSLKDLKVVAVDSSPEALAQVRRLWTAYSRELGIAEDNLVVCRDDLGGTAIDGWRGTAAEHGPYDLIIAANCLNELFVAGMQRIKERSQFVADLLTQLAPHGTVMIVEPALRDTSRALHQVRDELLAERRCTIYSPCLHEGNCPALLDPDDWCHEERPWEAPIAIRRIDREAGFIKDALKFSYLLLRTDGRTVADRNPETFRMVSELRKLKGDTRAWLCNERGRSEIGRLDRVRSDGNAALDDCQRGTIVRIEGLTRKQGAALARIPAEGRVQIVRQS